MTFIEEYAKDFKKQCEDDGLGYKVVYVGNLSINEQPFPHCVYAELICDGASIVDSCSHEADVYTYRCDGCKTYSIHFKYGVTKTFEKAGA